MTTGVDCLVYVNGQRLPDGQPTDDPLDPTALSGLTVTWGRGTTVDQPSASTCEFDVVDEVGGRAFLEMLRTGSPVSVIASGHSYPDPSAPTVVDPGFEGAAVGSTISARVLNVSATVVDEMAATGVHSARLQAPTGSSTSPSSAVFPPAPFSSLPAAWDAIPTTAAGQTWRVGATVRARAGAQIIMQAVSFSRPDGSYSLVPGALVSVPADGNWQQLAVTLVPPADGEWLGVSVKIGSTGERWVDATGSWADAAGDTPSSVAAAAGLVRTNRATRPYPGVAGGWASNNAASYPVTRDTVVVRRPGTTSAKLVRQAANPGGSLASVYAAGQTGWSLGSWLPVTPGEVIPVSIWVRCSLAGARGQITLNWFNAAGTALSPANTVSPLETLAAVDTWQQLSASFTVPAGAAWIGSGATILGPVGYVSVGGELSYMQDVMIGEGDYLDGNMPDIPSTTMTEGVDYAWTGAAFGSTSTATTTAVLPVTGPPWLDYAAAHVDDLLVLEPAGGTTRTVSVFEGRITDLVASFDDSAAGLVVHVTAADFTADLENVNVGDEPWTVESMADRFTRIVTLSQLAVETHVDDTIGATLVSYQDVDSQPTVSLLKDLAQSVDGILWPAVHQTTGAYLWVEDPSLRLSMFVLMMVDGLVQVVPNAASDALELSACDILRDPVDWVQNVSDVSTRAAVAWLEQIVDDEGDPDTLEHTVTVADELLEADYGVRRIQLSTLLQSQDDALAVATRILARTSQTDWRAGGITIDDDDSLEAGPEAAGTLLTLLDGTSRIGLPIRLTDLPAWSPRTPEVPVFLEGGSYAFLDGAWTLSLTISPANAQGASATWAQLPPAWRWVDVAPDVSWSDVLGVGVPPTATQKRRKP